MLVVVGRDGWFFVIWRGVLGWEGGGGGVVVGEGPWVVWSWFVVDIDVVVAAAVVEPFQ